MLNDMITSIAASNQIGEEMRKQNRTKRLNKKDGNYTNRG